MQHTRAYDTATPAAGSGPFVTTKEELRAIWGPQQLYYYTGSDECYHYLTLYYDTFFKHQYDYAIFRGTYLGEAPFEHTADPSLRKPLRLPTD
ncbi:hypothetical protein GCM10023185_27340 [Hymenobacter saemangeumensis]|uniref:Uncharacterized protein n=1 Tax=Hymenobacter saemangeumensis TaxID=1084522 RepID=A0ABP8IJK5_9BACT